MAGRAVAVRSWLAAGRTGQSCGDWLRPAGRVCSHARGNRLCGNRRGPEAPPGPAYRQDEFERSELPGGLDAVIACTSLHHVVGLDEALDKMHALLAPGGVIVVVEWARERFDEATARWCFDRLPEPHESHLGWLHERHAEWAASGQSWDTCLRSWAEAENLHTGQAILDALQPRFAGQHLSFGPYFFADLGEVSEEDERAAISAGLIRANRINYVARKDTAPGPPA